MIYFFDLKITLQLMQGWRDMLFQTAQLLDKNDLTSVVHQTCQTFRELREHGADRTLKSSHPRPLGPVRNHNVRITIADDLTTPNSSWTWHQDSVGHRLLHWRICSQEIGSHVFRKITENSI